MANLQDVPNPAESRLQQRLLLGVPIGLGAVLAALIVGFGVVPRWLQLRADSERLALLEDLKARLPLLRAQIAKTASDQMASERKQVQVQQLIRGSGDFSAFLAQLDREATRLGVQLALYEPVSAPATPAGEQDPKKAEGTPAPAAPKPPLEAAGLKPQQVLLTATAAYPDLLAFLRAMEKLTILVSQANLSLMLVASPKEVPAGLQMPSQTELKLLLTYYQTADPAVATPVAGKP